MYNLSVIGTGYVGLVAGSYMADSGFNVICVDNNTHKIKEINKGQIPIYEPNLENIIKKNVNNGRLVFTTDIELAVKQSDIIFIAVGTPSMEDGRADVQYVLQAAEEIAAYMNGYKVIVNKSTVPIGTGQRIKGVIQDLFGEKGGGHPFDIVANPEFLREGCALHDIMHPDRVVLGVESQRAEAIMKDIYRTVYKGGVPLVITGIETAEMIKYACNAYLAIKITFINEIANLCDEVGADVKQVAQAMGMDRRISPMFLQPGPGYGGSCFPKDTRAIARVGREHGVPLTLIEQTIVANENQKLRMVNKIKQAMGDLQGKVLAVLGITFKPDTDDLREAPSLVILDELVEAGAKLKVFDPKGYKEGKWRLKHIKEHIMFCINEYEAIENSHGVVILTEWNQFKNMNLDSMRNNMRDGYFFDFRNIYDRKTVEQKGFRYYGVGR